MRERFKPWWHGKCEVHLFSRRMIPLTGYCDKRGRWFMTANGYILCGEHKRKVERATQD